MFILKVKLKEKYIFVQTTGVCTHNTFLHQSGSMPCYWCVVAMAMLKLMEG